MTNGAFSTYVDRLMHHEIIPTLVEIGIDKTEAAAFADYVIDRFSNPYLEHKWESISANYTSKMRMRNLSTLDRYFKDGSRGDANYKALGLAGSVRAMEEKGRTERKSVGKGKR